MDWWWIALIAYGGIAVFVALWSIIVYMDGNWRARRAAARVFFLSWAWPLLLIRLLWYKLNTMWDEAEWGHLWSD